MSSVLAYSTDTATVQRERIQRRQKTQRISAADRMFWAAYAARWQRQRKEHEEKCPEFGTCTLHGWTD